MSLDANDENESEDDVLPQNDNGSNDDTKSNDMIQIPMDEFSGDVDLDEVQENLHWNIEQHLLRQQKDRQKYVGIEYIMI